MPLDKLEQLLAAGAYLQVRKEADRLLLEGNLSLGQEGAVLRLACRAGIFLGDYYAAAKLGERALERAREAGDTDTLGRAHFDLGVAYTYIGDTHLAQQNLESFLSLYHAMTDAQSLEAKAYYNLAILHRQRKQWHTAVQTLEKAASLCEKRGQTKLRAKCALDMAWSYLMLGAAALAAPHLAYLEEYLNQTPDDELTADLICEKALYFRLEGDIPTSSHLCQEIFVPGRLGVTSHQLGEASWIMGENALDLGQLDEASIFADAALEHAAQDNWPSLMNLACDLRRRIKTRRAPGA